MEICFERKWWHLVDRICKKCTKKQDLGWAYICERLQIFSKPDKATYYVLFDSCPYNLEFIVALQENAKQSSLQEQKVFQKYCPDMFATMDWYRKDAFFFNLKT